MDKNRAYQREFHVAKIGHLDFLEDNIKSGNTDKITTWVENKLIDKNSNITQANKDAFYEAEQSFICGHIKNNNHTRISDLLNAIANNKFSGMQNYKKLKLNQSKILANAITKEAEFLKQDHSMHEFLYNLLTQKHNELKAMNQLTENEADFKDKVSSAITEVLSIVSSCNTKEK